MIAIAEETAPSQAQAPAAEAKATKKAARSPRGAHSTAKRKNSGKKASPAKKAAKSAKKETGARDGSKAAKILELLQRPGGVTSKELQKPQAGNRIRYVDFCRAPSAKRWVWPLHLARVRTASAVTP